MGELLRERIEQVDSASVCSDPYFIVGLLIEAADGVVAKSSAVAGHYDRVGHH